MYNNDVVVKTGSGTYQVVQYKIKFESYLTWKLAVEIKICIPNIDRIYQKQMI